MKEKYVYARIGSSYIKRLEHILDIGENEILAKDTKSHIVLNKKDLISEDIFNKQQISLKEDIERIIACLLHEISTKQVYDYTLKDLKKAINKIAMENKDLFI